MTDEIDFEKGVELSKVPAAGLIKGCFRGQPVVLTQHHGKYCALSGKCTHMGAPLNEGIVVDAEVHCPWHHARFSVETGEAVAAPAFEALTRFETTVVDGRVFVVGSDPASERAAVIVAGSPPAGRVVIVGSGAGGYACAELLSRHGYPAPITVVSDDPDPPYDRTVCSKQYLIGMQSREESLIGAASASSRSTATDGLLFRLGCRVKALNAQEKFILLEDNERVDFDVLVLATGAEPKRPDWPGSDLPNVYLLRTLRDADNIIRAAGCARNVAIIGSSFIGLETAASLKQRKLDVHVVTPEDVPLEKLVGPDIGRMIRGVHEEKGVQFHFGRKVQGYDGAKLVLDDNSVIQADFIVLGIGVVPRTDLAAAAGLACAPADQGGGIVVSERLETSAAGIFAVGDVALYPDLHAGERIRVEHWAHAQRQGQHVARVIMGQAGRYSGLPFFWSAHFDTGLRYIGHVDSITDTNTDGSVEGRNFSRLLSGRSKKQAFVTCNRDMESLVTEAKWDAAVKEAP